MFNLIGQALAQTATTRDTVRNELNTGLNIGLFTGDIRDIVANLINGILILAGIIVVVYLIYGGIMYTTAGDNTDQAGKAKTVIVNAIIGVVIIAAALVVTRLVTSWLR